MTASYGSFGTSNLGFNLGYGGEKWGNFISASGLNGASFWILPSSRWGCPRRRRERKETICSTGSTMGFDRRLDSREPRAKRSSVSTPNSYDAQDATPSELRRRLRRRPAIERQRCRPGRPRSRINTFNVAPSSDSSGRVQQRCYLGAYSARCLRLLSQFESFCGPGTAGGQKAGTVATRNPDARDAGLRWSVFRTLKGIQQRRKVGAVMSNTFLRR